VVDFIKSIFVSHEISEYFFFTQTFNLLSPEPYQNLKTKTGYKVFWFWIWIDLFVKLKFQKRSALTPIIIGGKLNNPADGGGFN